jgi:hypothetical protein
LFVSAPYRGAPFLSSLDGSTPVGSNAVHGRLNWASAPISSGGSATTHGSPRLAGTILLAIPSSIDALPVFAKLSSTTMLSAEECSCHGLNPNCYRCSGTGAINADRNIPISRKGRTANRVRRKRTTKVISATPRVMQICPICFGIVWFVTSD